MNEYRKKCTELYRKLSQYVSIHSFDIHTSTSTSTTSPDDDDSAFHWSSVYSQRDLDRMTHVKYRVGGYIAFNKDGCATPIITTRPEATELHNEKLFSRSPCGNFTAVIREVKKMVNDAANPQQFLEVWDTCRKIKSVDLKSEDRHGVVHSNLASFARLRWSHDCKKILYVAERKVKKSESYFVRKSTAEEEDDDSNKGDQFAYQDKWGDGLPACKCPSLYVFDISTDAIIDFDDAITEDITVHDPVWSKDDKHIVFGGYRNQPFRMGFVYCKNRPCSIYCLNVVSKTVENVIGDYDSSQQCLFSPTLSPCGSKLIYLAIPAFEQYVQCSKLMVADIRPSSKNGLSFGPPEVLVDTVHKPKSSDDFAGLYLGGLSKDNWLSNGRQLVVTSFHCSHGCILLIDISNGQVDILEKGDGYWQVFRVYKDRVFASYHSPNTPPVLKCGTFSDDRKALDWVDLSRPNEPLPDISWRILKFRPDSVNEQYPELSFETVLYTPKSSPPIGLIVNPHGGPHSLFFTDFHFESAFWCSLGYAVARVNYRGSIGFGQNSVLSLPGRIGTQDAQDVQQAAVFVKDLLGVDDVFVTGGSHGGFLSLHLIGQYPSFYAAAAMRNPVASLLATLEGSDITDWTFCENGFRYDYTSVMTKDVVDKLFDVSPIRYAPDVKTPVLFLLGEKDRRVPPCQSFHYSRVLKSRGVSVKILHYPDYHPLTEVDVEADCAMNKVMWFYQHSKQTK